jgi:hypothetical protein
LSNIPPRLSDQHVGGFFGIACGKRASHVEPPEQGEHSALSGTPREYQTPLRAASKDRLTPSLVLISRVKLTDRWPTPHKRTMPELPKV